MKYLKSINKGKDSNFLVLVFADFIDDGAKFKEYTYYRHTNGDVNKYTCWEININEPKLSYSSDIDLYVDSIDKIHEFSLDIKSCIDKIKAEMPDIIVDFYIEETGENNKWVNTIQKVLRICFIYKK